MSALRLPRAAPRRMPRDSAIAMVGIPRRRTACGGRLRMTILGVSARSLILAARPAYAGGNFSADYPQARAAACSIGPPTWSPKARPLCCGARGVDDPRHASCHGTFFESRAQRRFDAYNPCRHIIHDWDPGAVLSPFLGICRKAMTRDARLLIARGSLPPDGNHGRTSQGCGHGGCGAIPWW
jgi:hypothetical protein